MKAPIASQRSSASANLTPMIDVVFLLIIFFLVSSHLAKRELHQPMELPSARSHEVGESIDARFTFNVDGDGTITAASHRVAMDQIGTVIRQRQTEPQNPPAVRIRTEKSANYASVEPLLRELAKAGVIDIAFAVQDEPMR